MGLSNREVVEIKGEISFSEIMNNDQSNIANHYNTHRFRQMLEGNVNSPALTYLLNTGHMGISDYKTLDYFNNKMIAVKEMTVGSFSEKADKQTISLDTHFKNRKVSMDDILNHRMSTRKFSVVKMSFKIFSQTLHVLCDTSRQQTYMNFTVPSRAYGSGGGLYPISVYLLVLNVIGVDRGWYKLQPHTNSIQPIRVVDNGSVDVIPGKNIAVNDASFIIFYSFDLTKSYPKYGESSIELGLEEIGEMAELVDLQSAALELGSCQSAGFRKSEIQKTLSLDGVTEQILHSQIIGEL